MNPEVAQPPVPESVPEVPARPAPGLIIELSDSENASLLDFISLDDMKPQVECTGRNTYSVWNNADGTLGFADDLTLEDYVPPMWLRILTNQLIPLLIGLTIGCQYGDWLIKSFVTVLLVALCTFCLHSVRTKNVEKQFAQLRKQAGYIFFNQLVGKQLVGHYAGQLQQQGALNQQTAIRMNDLSARYQALRNQLTQDQLVEHDQVFGNVINGTAKRH